MCRLDTPITAPSFYSFEKAPLKAAGSTVVGLLALLQLWSMETAMGHLPRAGLKMKVLMRTHRYTGRIALVLAAVVAYFCLTDVGVETNVLRGAIHGFFGSTAFVAIAIKLALLRFRPRLAYDAAPWLGRYAAFAFIVVWITSAYAFFTFGSSAQQLDAFVATNLSRGDADEHFFFQETLICVGVLATRVAGSAARGVAV